MVIVTGATVRIRVLVPAAIGRGKWEWRVISRLDPLGVEDVRDSEELSAVLRTYGRIVARMLRPWEGESFRLLACDAGSHAVGIHEYLWDGRTNAYHPRGDPWCLLG